MSQTLSVLSLLPLTNSLLSADHATWYTDATWPRSDIKYLWAGTQASKQKHYTKNLRLTAPSPGQQQYCTQIQYIHAFSNVHDGWVIFLLSSASIPDFNGFIKWCRGEEPGIWREEHFIDQSAVAGHPGQRLLVFCRVPQEQCEIIWARHQTLWSGALQHENKRKGDDTESCQKEIWIWTHHNNLPWLYYIAVMLSP